MASGRRRGWTCFDSGRRKAPTRPIPGGSVGSFSSCPVLVAHHMSASGLRMTRQVSEAVDALARGWGQAETSGALTLLVFLAGFFVRSEGGFFVPTCAG